MRSPAVSGFPEISDDDTISLTSTVSSKKGDEYPLEGILAERPLKIGDDGELEYLVKWEGYELMRSTWEPRSSFTNDGTLQEWEEQKKRIARGDEEAFDTEAFDSKIRALDQEQRNRHLRRRAKRIKLNLPVSLSTSSSEKNYETDDGVTSAEEALKRPPRSRMRTARVDDRIDNDERVFTGRDLSRRQNKRSLQKKASQDEETGLSDDSLIEEIRRNKSMRNPKRDSEAGKSQTGVRAAAELKPFPRPKTAPLKTNPISSNRATDERKESIARGTGPSRRACMAIPGRGPSRRKKSPKSKPKVYGGAILNNWDAPKKKRGLPPLNQSASAVPDLRPSNKLSVRNRFIKAGRNEPAPNPNDLDFFVNKGGKILHSTVDKGPVKTPFQSIMERQEQAESSLLSLNAEGSKQTTSGAEMARTVDNIIGGQQMESPDQDHGSASLPEAVPSKGGLHSPTINSSSANHSRTQQHSTSLHNIAQSSKINSIPLAAYTSRQSSVREIPGAGYLAQPEYRVGQAQQDNTLTVEDMGDVKSKTVDGLTSLLFFFGEQDGKPVKVGITNLDRTLEAHLLGHTMLAKENLPIINFNQAVTAEDSRTYHLNLERNTVIANGDVIPSPESQNHLEDVVETLKLHNVGGLHLNEQYMILVYPIKVDTWNYLEQSGPPVPNAMLRYQIRSLPNLQISNPIPPTSPSALSVSESNIIITFREVLCIKYEDLLPSNMKPGGKVDKVFVICPPTYQDELNLIVAFLEASGATVLTSQTAGAWDCYLKEVDAGVVLIHPSFCYYHEIPNLVHVLKRNFSLFHIGADPHLGTSTETFTLTRLFPHGRAILLTERLFVKNPGAAKQIVLWFKQDMKRKAAGTWKLVGRPGLREWVLDLAENSNEAQQEDLFETFIALDRLISHSTTELAIDDDQDEGIMSFSPLISWDVEHDEAAYDKLPNYGKDLDDDTEFLATWFAGWAATKARDIRRFMIVDPCPAEHWRRWQTIEVCTPAGFIKDNVERGR